MLRHCEQLSLLLRDINMLVELRCTGTHTAVKEDWELECESRTVDSHGCTRVKKFTILLYKLLSSTHSARWRNRICHFLSEIRWVREARVTDWCVISSVNQCAAHFAVNGSPSYYQWFSVFSLHSSHLSSARFRSRSLIPMFFWAIHLFPGGYGRADLRR